MKLNCVNLEAFLEKTSSLEQSIAEVHAKNSTLELMLEASSRGLKQSQSKEKSLAEERDSLLITMNQLQQTLEHQCHIRVENETLKSDLEEEKRKNAKRAEEKEAEVQRLMAEMRAQSECHQRALEAVRCQSRRDMEEAQVQALKNVKAKEVELQKLLDQKEVEMEEMRMRLREQERDRQSELLKLQMEFGAKMARVQSSAQMTQHHQQQQHGSTMSQNIFRRKLQFLQEEKNKEVATLRQRIRELEESQLTGPKRRNVTFNI